MSEPLLDESSQASQDRRAESREQASSLTDVTTRLVGGSDLTPLNYTSRSLYAQSSSRLVVGARVSVRVATATLQAVVAGRVVRCSLTQLVAGVPRYEVAVAFDGDVDWSTAKPKDLQVSFDDDAIDFTPGYDAAPAL